MEDTSFLEAKRGELSKAIEAIQAIESSLEWQTLKKLVLDGIVASLERQLTQEASREVIDTPKMYRLQGQVTWAKKYSDLGKFVESLKVQLANIKNQIHADENPADGAA